MKSIKAKMVCAVAALLGGALVTHAAFATPIAMGYVSYDVTGLNVAQFDINNETGPNSSGDPTFPVTTSVSLSDLSLDVMFASGSDEVYGPSYFTLSADGISWTGTPLSTLSGQPNGLAGATSAVLTGIFDTTSLTLYDASTVTIDPTFSVTISDPSGLTDGDFGILYANPSSGGVTPEPASFVLVGTSLLALVSLRRRRLLSLARNAISWRPIGAGSAIGLIALAGAALLGVKPISAQTIKLNTWTNPSSGASGSAIVTLTGSGFPTGTVSPSSITLSLGTACMGTAAATESPASVTNILGSEKRLSLLVPASLATGTYYISATGTYSSSDCAEISVTPPAPTGIQVALSDSNPPYNEAVTLTATAQPAGATFTGTISFYEDPGALLNTPANGVNGILLGQISVTNQSTAQYAQLGFLGGQHTIEAIFSSDSTLTSATVPLNVTAAIAVPAEGEVYLGATAGGSPGSHAIGNPSIDTMEESFTTGTGSYGIGRPYALDIKYYSGKGKYTQWNQLAGELVGGLGGTFAPDPALTDDLLNGRIPSISWACDVSYSGAYSGADAAIAAWDDSQSDITVIRETAQALKQFGAPVMLRYNWEFNILGGNNGTCAGVGANGPWTQTGWNNFIGAWQTVWQIFQQEGATNVVFDWNPGSYKEGTKGTTLKSDPHPFYPGDTFVDWIGEDSYQDANWDPAWTFSDVIDNQNGGRGPWYTDFSSHNKPMMIGETGAQNQEYDCKVSQGLPPYEVQGPYIASMQMDFDNKTYPLLHAVEWFDECSSLLDYGDSGYADPQGITAMNTLGGDPAVFQAGMLASAPLPTSNIQSSNYPMPLSLSNTGLLPLISVSVTSISNITDIDGGTGTVTPPVIPPGGILFPNFSGNSCGGSVSCELQYSNLEAGQTATVTTPNFTWPATATCVQMTISYSAMQSDDNGGTTPYTGPSSNTIKVARLPGIACP
jgi:hypothetical protein